MNKWIRVTALAAAGVAALAGWNGLSQPTERAAYAAQRDDEPELSKKIVPIVTFGSNLNVGVAQVEGTRHRVGDVKAVASQGGYVTILWPDLNSAISQVLEEKAGNEIQPCLWC